MACPPIVVQVAFQQFLRRQRGVLPVQPALHGIADHKGQTTRTVVGAGAVVMHVSAKLGEQQNYYAQDMVRILRQMGARALFATHLHELAADVATLNATTAGDSLIVSLVASRALDGERVEHS